MQFLLLKQQTIVTQNFTNFRVKNTVKQKQIYEGKDLNIIIFKLKTWGKLNKPTEILIFGGKYTQLDWSNR